MRATSRRTPFRQGGVWGGDSSLLRTLETKWKTKSQSLWPQTANSGYISVQFLRKKETVPKGREGRMGGFSQGPSSKHNSRKKPSTATQSCHPQDTVPILKAIMKKCEQHFPKRITRWTICFVKSFTCSLSVPTSLCSTTDLSFAMYTITLLLAKSTTHFPN